MGCSTSRTNEETDLEDNQRQQDEQFVFLTPGLEKLLHSKEPYDMLKAFMQLDKAIMDEENRNPSSLFGQAMSRQQQIKALLQSAMEIKAQNEILSGESSVFDLFHDLGLVRNPKLAAEHEEFFAAINRRAINQNAIDVLQRILEKVESQIRNSSRRISQLQSAYHQQDELLGQIFGETYGSETERLLERELDTMRYYRDMLAIGVLQWEVCVDNINSAAMLLRKGVSSWKMIKKERLQRKIDLAAEARNSFQEAVLLVQTSEELLQDVQFPFCTTRELRGVSQATDYVFTDILIEERYLHATEVYENFLQRASSLHEWVKEVLSSKLQKDLLEIEEKVSEATIQLRNERIFLICKKLKIETPPEDLDPPSHLTAAPILNTYDPKTRPPVLDLDRFPLNLETKLGLGQDRDGSIQNYFRKVVESRKNTMWPSRRIDELPALLMQQQMKMGS